MTAVASSTLALAPDLTADGTPFLENDCHSWSVIGAHDFADTS